MLISMNEFTVNGSREGEVFLDHDGAEPPCYWDYELSGNSLKDLIEIATQHVKDKHSTR